MPTYALVVFNKKSILVLVKHCYFMALIVCLGALLYSCTPKTDGQLADIYIDTVFITLPSNTSANLIQPTLWEGDGEERIAAYNYLDHSISVMNLTKRSYEMQIKLEASGPDFVDPISGLVRYDDGKWLLVNENYLTLIDSNGRVIKRLRINNPSTDLEGFDFTLGRVDANRNSGLPFDQGSKEIFLRALVRNKTGGIDRKIAAINIDTEEIRLIEIPQFESFQPDQSYGSLNGFAFTRYNNQFLLNPKYASELIIADDYQHHYYLNSNITLNRASIYSATGEYANSLNHQLKSVEFYPVFRSHSGRHIFRIHKGAINSDGIEPFYLMLANQDVEVLSEWEFSQNHYISPIVSREGIMFVAFNKHDDKLELIRYHID